MFHDLCSVLLYVTDLPSELRSSSDLLILLFITFHSLRQEGTLCHPGWNHVTILLQSSETLTLQVLVLLLTPHHTGNPALGQHSLLWCDTTLRFRSLPCMARSHLVITLKSWGRGAESGPVQSLCPRYQTGFLINQRLGSVPNPHRHFCL